MTAVPLPRAGAPRSATRSFRRCRRQRARGERGSHPGLTKILLKGGDPGKSKILVKGKGGNLPQPALPFSQSINVAAPRTARTAGRGRRGWTQRPDVSDAYREREQRGRAPKEHCAFLRDAMLQRFMGRAFEDALSDLRAAYRKATQQDWDSALYRSPTDVAPHEPLELIREIKLLEATKRRIEVTCELRNSVRENPNLGTVPPEKYPLVDQYQRVREDLGRWAHPPTDGADGSKTQRLNERLATLRDLYRRKLISKDTFEQHSAKAVRESE